MNIWENAVITSKGLALQSKLTQGTSLTITRAVAGAGYVTPALLVQQTAVLDPKQTLKFSPASYPEEGKCAVPVYLTNEGLATGYTAKQVGFYATDPDEGEILYFICQAASDKGTEIPSKTEMPGYTAEWTFYFQYGQASNVTVTVDPANTVTRAEVKKMIAQYGGGPVAEAISSDGLDYTVTIPELAEITPGCKITVIPNMNSTWKSPNFNVNGIGFLPTQRKVAGGKTNYTLSTGGLENDWLRANLPYTLTYISNTLGWFVEGEMKPNAEDLTGVVSVLHGGTGAINASGALENLGAAKADLTNVTDKDFAAKAAKAGGGGIPIIEVTSEDGMVYTATCEGLTIKNGSKITIIPVRESAEDAGPVLALRLNGTEYKIDRRVDYSFNGFASASDVGFIPYVPYTLTYYDETGTLLLEGYGDPIAKNLLGLVPIEKGGTGSATAMGALKKLGAAPMYTYGTEDLVAGETPLETGKLHFVYE